MRQVILDTETTGLEPQQGHRVIEIGCVELLDRRLTGRRFHYYLQPDRDIDEGAVAVHGISTEFLADKPRFAEVADEFLEFVQGAELVIHNAPFDVGFLDAEFSLLEGEYPKLRELCEVEDTLILARQMHPGQRNSLDALCKRYGVNNDHRELHGALLDAQILADVYLAMTGGQTSLLPDEFGDSFRHTSGNSDIPARVIQHDRKPLPVIHASPGEREAHESLLDRMGGDQDCIWRKEAGELSAGLENT